MSREPDCHGCPPTVRPRARVSDARVLAILGVTTAAAVASVGALVFVGLRWVVRSIAPVIGAVIDHLVLGMRLTMGVGLGVLPYFLAAQAATWVGVRVSRRRRRRAEQPARPPLALMPGPQRPPRGRDIEEVMALIERGTS